MMIDEECDIALAMEQALHNSGQGARKEATGDKMQSINEDADEIWRQAFLHCSYSYERLVLEFIVLDCAP